jgi:hypothetical protein
VSAEAGALVLSADGRDADGDQSAAEPGKVPSVAMALPPGVDLPDEAVDVTATEAHNRLVSRLWLATRLAFGDRALVLSDIFVRVDDRRQAAPDLLIAPPSTIANHRVYRVPDEPVPLDRMAARLRQLGVDPEGG